METLNGQLVLIVMLVVRSEFVVCSALGPKFVSKMQAPNFPQDIQNCTKNEAGISQKGSESDLNGTENRYKKAKMGPKWTTRGPETDFGAKKEANGAKR